MHYTVSNTIKRLQLSVSKWRSGMKPLSFFLICVDNFLIEQLSKFEAGIIQVYSLSFHLPDELQNNIAIVDL